MTIENRITACRPEEAEVPFSSELRFHTLSSANAQTNIFYAVLNWGLGHATRSLPLISKYLAEGKKLTIASDGAALVFLKNEMRGHQYPECQLRFLELESYDISYGSSSLLREIMSNGPKIYRAMYRENRVLKKWLHQNKCDLIISDGRFGCYHKSVKSILVNHITQVPTSEILSQLVSRMLRRSIEKFDELWIPDEEDAEKRALEISPQNQAAGGVLSGALSAGKLSIPRRFIGFQSTMKTDASEEKKYDAIAIISGPEPARTEFERQVILQLNDLPGQYIIVGGKIHINIPPKVSHTRAESREIVRNTTKRHIEYKSWLDRNTLNKLVNQSEMVICRTGYSSLMDLKVLGKKALLIPTPGQPEQEYLGQHLADEDWWITQSQDYMDIGAVV